MATLLLTAVGTALGGPFGGAIGALAGRSIDGAIIGGGKREGARLKELAVTTSSYGHPIARHHGRMRAAGTIIWATDLVEHKDKSGGKKGQPSVTTYAYTSSFAVALSSRPILGIGRVWADGNLLRGAAGDLKVAGMMRIHTGRGDQAPDPLIAAAQGASAPAFRDCAYVVFEDLALEQFGNRIPALTFEILADDGAIALADLIDPLGTDVAASEALAPLAGFANEGGPLAATLDTIDTLFPLSVDAGGARLTIDPVRPSNLPITLPPPARAWDENDCGLGEGRRQDRDAGEAELISALRYYDIARDFQPGVQRPAGRATSGVQRTIELPGAFAADDARALADAAARRLGARRETLQWRVAELDPALAPGADVMVPGKPGVWRIETWEWRERGIELGLVRRDPRTLASAAADPGTVLPPVDAIAGPTVLRVFELPPLGTDPSERTLFAAATGTGAWSGCALYLDRAGELIPVGRAGREKATIGTLAAPLAPSPALLFEPQSTLDIELLGGSAGLPSASLASVLQGANRLLVGGEVLQFAEAAPTGPATWRLTGLLRGRGGTEAAAAAGHAAGTSAVLIDASLVALDPALVPSNEATTIAAIGPMDAEPVYATLANAGLGRKPLAPVHPRCVSASGGGLVLDWVRRACGAWEWLDGVDAPLVEESEAYRVGFGPADAPVAEWRTEAPHLELDGAAIAALVSEHPGEPMWVRQIGRFAQSDPLLLTRPA
jgi:hypothetical protein